MPTEIVPFCEEELQQLRELKIAIFRNKIILDAQPPITAEQLTEVKRKVDGELPLGLIELWKISFGGMLDYDYQINFDGHLFAASLRELYYPGSRHYDDLHGWIDHEIETLQEVAEEDETEPPTRTPFVPFGGFEYLERFYVSLEPDEYGAVIAYAKGIPWKGRLNVDSVATVEDSVAALFDQLSLFENPQDPKASAFAHGKDMAQRIQHIAGQYPELAAKLTKLMQASVVDWRETLQDVDLANELTHGQQLALRLALRYAIDHQDLKLLDQLRRNGVPLATTLYGTQEMLGYAMIKQSYDVVERLLAFDSDLGDKPILAATDCPDKLLLELVGRGAWFDDGVVYEAAETGATGGALMVVRSGNMKDRPADQTFAETAMQRAEKCEQDAASVELDDLSSYLTPEQYRERAERLRHFASFLTSEQEPPQAD
ncbi:SMI1/KNR4 family protein [Blastopirellula retiformator]|uniref:SMI1 / KNR4 family protein n=1 Tax=Blastopirellula retiformator TaxID=2527970 RepID=A0A5C5UW62_9BACT|nr:SMI1/KNR4 family protein [Blastopirellula retiformator]TWT30591.1 hypothetical protein Enr8_41120 [Blastopirellula retiformator]